MGGDGAGWGGGGMVEMPLPECLCLSVSMYVLYRSKMRKLHLLHRKVHPANASNADKCTKYAQLTMLKA